MGDATDRYGDGHYASEQSPVLSLAYCYVITYETGDQTFLTSHDKPMLLTGLPASVGGGDQTFTPAQINHGPTEIGLGYSETTVDVAIAIEEEKLRKLAITTATKKILVHIIRVSAYKVADGDAVQLSIPFAQFGMTVFGGEVEGITTAGRIITVTLAPEPFVIDRSVPRMYFQRACNHVLFDPATCRADKPTFEELFTSASSSHEERRIYAATPLQPSGYFGGGHAIHVPTNLIFQIEHDGISDPGGNTFIQISTWSSDIGQADAWKIYPGCNRTTGDCGAKFNNLPNFGGFPYVPNKNPSLHGAS